MREKFRMRIAKWTDRFPDTCWADLVMWAIFSDSHPFYEIFQMRNTRQFCEYCGKCPTMLFFPGKCL